MPGALALDIHVVFATTVRSFSKVSVTMPQTRILDGELDLRIRAADRLDGYWEASGDIVERHSGKSIGRVYGRGRTNEAAGEEVSREAERWVLRGVKIR